MTNLNQSKKNNYKGVLILIGLAVAAIGVSYMFSDDTNVVTFADDVELNYELADTNELRLKGLSGRDSLEQDSSMIFVFDNSARHGIWMKDMKFEIDVMWLDEDKNIVHIVEFMDPESYPQTFKPDTVAKYVIETNAGFIEDNNIQLGDQVTF